MEKDGKKRLIICFLKKNGRSSTTRIAAAINSDIWRCRSYLKSLENEKKIKKEVESLATFWILV